MESIWCSLPLELLMLPLPGSVQCNGIKLAIIGKEQSIL